MQHAIVAVATGSLVGEGRGISLARLCRACGLSVEAVRARMRALEARRQEGEKKR